MSDPAARHSFKVRLALAGVIAGAGAALPPAQRDMIIAYKLGATGKLPDTVGP